MRPSISVSLDPGLERGVPWGRDLYTFVTSAAGHMMRTLQKPRKNRPSKRQVNHRRFLHNMIQRKFADIEAANHRLASAIYFNDEEKNMPSLSSHKPGTPEQSGNPSQREGPDEGCAGSDETVKSSESYEKQHQQELQSPICSAQMNNQSESGQREETDHKLADSTFTKGTEDHRSPEIVNLECLSENGTCKPMDSLSDDTQTSLKESGFRQFDQNVDISRCFSPELSPLALDSYDFSIQGPTDKSACLQAQRSLTDICEGQLNDIMDFLCVGSEDFVGCTDLETYFDSMCACQGGAGPENEADDVTYVGQSDSFTEDLLCDQSESTYTHRHSCPEDQVPRINQSNQQTLRSSVYTPEEQFYSSGSLLNASAGRHRTRLHMSPHTQEKSTCMMLTCDSNPNFTPFEGVAQSFSVPPHNPENRPIPTPPHEDDWLFTDILKDRKSPDFP